MNKREYAQANKEWLVNKAQEEGVKPLPKGIYPQIRNYAPNMIQKRK